MFNNLKINNRFVDPTEDGPLREEISSAEAIYLTPEHKSFTLYFSVMHYAFPEKNKYKYKLEGFDDEWVVTDFEKRFATYTNLSGGEYIFLVKGANPDGVWNEEATSIKVVVKPPFYATLWFYFLIAFMVVGLFFLYMRFSRKRAKAIQRRLQDKIDVAVSKAEEQTRMVEKQNEEMLVQREIENKRNWINNGKSEFTAVLKENRGDVSGLCVIVLQKLVRYINAVQGGVFVLNEDDKQDRFLELMASYAYEDDRFGCKRMEIGETLLGNCFKESTMK